MENNFILLAVCLNVIMVSAFELYTMGREVLLDKSILGVLSRVCLSAEERWDIACGFLYKSKLVLLVLFICILCIILAIAPMIISVGLSHLFMLFNIDIPFIFPYVLTSFGIYYIFFVDCF